MTAWQLIKTHLLADSNVTSVATGGIYPVRGKQGETRPMVVSRQTGSGDEDEISGVLVFLEATLDIGCVATTYDSAVTLYEAVRTSLRSMRQQTVSGKRVHSVVISQVREEDYPDENVSLFAVMFTVTIKHQA